MGIIIGIDLGTTNSAAAIFDKGVSKLIPSSDGGHLTPSVVAIKTDSAERIIGHAVSREAVTPENIISSIKRFMGRKYDEINGDNKELKKAAELAPYELVPANNGDICVRIDDRDYSPPEISAMILQKLKADAEAHLGESVDQAVISVPAYFNDAQRKATKDAGKIAGLEVLRIINEPTAASLAYGLDRNRDGLIAVYDLGGGTFDISIIQLDDGVFEVIATDGDAFLGGDDFDAPVIDWLAMQIERAHGFDPLQDATAVSRLSREARAARHELSTAEKVAIDLPNIVMKDGEAVNFITSLTRNQLLDLVNDPQGPIDRTLNRCGEVLKAAGKTTNEIDKVLLVGGMTKMPAIRSAVKGFFGKEPQIGINPDEAIALGTAIQAGILGGNVTGIALIDVTPLSLGLEPQGGIMDVIIPRNTAIPAMKTKNYTTVADDQTAVRFDVYQGERPMAADNTLLSGFTLDGIPPAPRGTPSFKVTFEIDANGILQVGASDTGTGRKQHITVDAESGLSDEEISRALAEAKRYAQEDEVRKKRAEAENAADIKVYRANRMLRDHREKLERVDISKLEFLIDATEQARKNGTAADIIKTSEELAEFTRELGEKMYRS